MKRRSVTLFISFLALLLAVPAAAQEEAEAPPTKRVGVFALDDSVRAQKLDQQVAEALGEAGLTVIHGYELQSIIESSIVPPPDSELASRFSSVSTVIGDGIKAFFYDGNTTAIERLSPVFDLGITHREVLTRRPDLADQVYEAGVVLLRAYQNEGQEDEMEAIGSLLVKTFPTRSPSPNTVPPKIIKYLQERSAELAQGGAELEFVGVGQGECIGYVNGAKVEGNAFPVSPGYDYFLRLDCGKSDSVVWRTTVSPSERKVVPVTSINPLDHEMESSSIEARRKTEDYMATLAHWANLHAVVGVSRKAAPGQDGVLVGRMERGATSWSDGVQNKSVRTALQRVFPEIARDIPNIGSEGEAQASGGGWTSDTIGWIFSGVGVGSAAGGAVVLILAEQRARQLLCSETAPNDVQRPASECDEDILADLSGQQATDEYQRLSDEVKRNRIIGWTLVGVGAASLGYGVYRFVTADESDGQKTTLIPVVGPNYAGAKLDVRF